MAEKTIKLAHGSGGTLMHKFIREHVLGNFASPLLAPLGDSARIIVHGGPIAFTTDSYVVDPIFFPGGNIGRLAVFGTVNDLAVSGAIPKFMSCALIIEEGMSESDLDMVLAAIRDASDEAQVEIVTGDTKVVPRGKADKIFINTAGVGIVPRNGRLPDAEMQAGDVLVVSGFLGDHGAAVLSRRQGLNIEANVLSDCAPVTAAAQAVLKTAERVSFLRDVTRGGIATILNEAVEGKGLGIVIEEQAVPVRPEVRSICELLGIDPLYLACEGRIAAIVDGGSANRVVAALRDATGDGNCSIIGAVVNEHPGRVVGRTPLGTHRLIQMLSGEQLPRIC
jgi:hydrogenase expression/formation protein HypE